MAKSASAKSTQNAADETTKLPSDFESAFSELETILTSMESGQMSLEQALTAYKRGDILLQFCQKTLNTAEQEVRILSEKNTLEPFESNE